MVIQYQTRIPDHFSFSTLLWNGILGDLLAFLIPADFYDTWRNDLRQL